MFSTGSKSPIGANISPRSAPRHTAMRIIMTPERTIGRTALRLPPTMRATAHAPQTAGSVMTRRNSQYCSRATPVLRII